MSVEGWKPPTLEEMKQLVDSIQRRAVSPPSPRSEAYQQERFAMAWLDLGVALGDLIGRLHEDDSSAQAIEYSLPSPRAYVIRPGDNVDKILSFLTDAEKELNDSPAIPHLAERTIVSLVNWLEPLAKRIWKNKFSGEIKDFRSGKMRKRVFTDLLREAREWPERSEERRFVELARILVLHVSMPSSSRP